MSCNSIIDKRTDFCCWICCYHFFPKVQMHSNLNELEWIQVYIAHCALCCAVRCILSNVPPHVHSHHMFWCHSWKMQRANRAQGLNKMKNYLKWIMPLTFMCILHDFYFCSVLSLFLSTSHSGNHSIQSGIPFYWGHAAIKETRRSVLVMNARALRHKKRRFSQSSK